MFARRNFLTATLGLVGIGTIGNERKIITDWSPFRKARLQDLDYKWAEINGILHKLPVLRFYTTNIISNKDQVFEHPVNKKMYGPDLGWEEAYAWLPFDRAQTLPATHAQFPPFENIVFWGAVRVVRYFHPNDVLDALLTTITIQSLKESKKATWGDIIS